MPPLLTLALLTAGTCTPHPLRVARGMKEAARRALTDPYVRRARAIRRLPGVIRLRLEHRRAVAIWRGGWLVDERGGLFRAARVPPGLPEVRGFDDPGEALGVLRRLRAAGLRPRRLWRDPCWGICLRTEDVLIRWGEAVDEGALRRLRAVIQDLRRRGLRARRLDLSLRGRVFVEIADAGAAGRP